jgi:AcrR family transcriptional regulator
VPVERIAAAASASKAMLYTYFGKGHLAHYEKDRRSLLTAKALVSAECGVVVN